MNTRRRVSVTALALVSIVFLAGCAAPTVNSAATPPSSPSPREPAPTPTVEPASDEGLVLTFGSAEQLIDPRWGVEWTDPYLTDEGFAVLAPDDGEGSWSYTDLSSSCELSFYQGEVSDLDWSADDRVVSDQMLAYLATGNPTPDDLTAVAANAVDVPLVLEPYDGQVEMRVIAGSFPDGRSAVQASRMFGALGAGITFSLVCPAGRDASSEFDRLTETSLRALVTK